MAQNWVQHTLERTGWKPQRQAAWLAVLGVLITLIFSGAYLSQIANYTTTNRDIEALIEDRDRLERENESLRAQIAQLQTVPRLLERAEALGFRQATADDIEYLVIEGYNPNRDKTIIPISREDEILDVPIYEDSFKGWLSQRWDALRQQFASFGR